MNAAIDRARTLYRGFLWHPERFVALILGVLGIIAIVLLITGIASGDLLLVVLGIVIVVAGGAIAARYRRLLGSFRLIGAEDRLIADYAARYPIKNLGRLAHVLELSRNTRGVEILAWAATNGRYTIAQLTTLLELYRDPRQQGRARRSLYWVDPTRGALLARVLLQQAIGPQDILVASTLARAVAEINGVTVIPGAHRDFFADRRIAPYDTGGPGWRAVFAATLPAEPTGPRVTLVITAVSPDAAITEALASALDSSWPDLEILVVVAGRAPKVARPTTVISAAEGTPEGSLRNLGLARASGEFVAFLPATGLEHPDRIATHVAVLLADESIPAVRGYAVSVDSDDTPIGAHTATPDDSSLLIRRALSIETVGYFDGVLYGGGSEYRRRLEAATGTQIPDAGEKAPSVRRAEPGIAAGQVRTIERFYNDCAAAWHARVRTGDASAVMAAEGGVRPFRAPSPVPSSDHYDVVFVSNWLDAGSKGGTQRSNEEEIRALQRAGYRVAIAHLDALWLTTTPTPTLALSPRIIAAIDADEVEVITLESEVTAELVIVRYPPVLQFQPAVASGIRTGSVLVVANQGPYENDGSSHRYTVHEADEQVRAMFGVTPDWAPQGPLIRAVLELLVEPGRLLESDVPALIDTTQWTVERAPREGRAPVVGRYSRDNVMKWPDDRRAIDAVYTSKSFSTVVMGGDKAIAAAYGGNAPASWNVWPEGAMPTREFLEKLDFFVYFHHSAYVEAFGRSIIEAMASGAVVILPRTFEPVFGDAALYCTPAEVEALVSSVWADSNRYDSTVRTAHDRINERWSYEFYGSLVASLLARNAPPQHQDGSLS